MSHPAANSQADMIRTSPSIRTSAIHAGAIECDAGRVEMQARIAVRCALEGPDQRGKRRERLINIADDISEALVKLVWWILYTAPIGVFGLMAFTVSQTGPVFLLSMLKYMVAVLVALALHLFVALPLMLFLIGKVNPWRHFRAMRTALLTAFSTASSSATLPVTMRCLQDNAGVSKRTSSFVLPLGATVNMDGTALYEVVAVLFIAQMLGEPTLAEQGIIAVTALLVSVGAAGIPHAGLVMMVVILEAVGLPTEATLVLLAVDRVADMARTAINVWSDAVGAAVVAAYTAKG